MEFKKRWLRFVYIQRLAFNVFRSEPWLDVVRHFRDLSGPVKVLWPSKNEIVDIETIVHTAGDVGADLAEVRAPFYVTGATIMSDGRKSRDARPIVNFLAGGSCGVMLVRTMNREGERDRAPDVLAHWIKVFDDFPPKWVNAICTDFTSAYVTAGNMLQGPQQRPEHQRITWLPCAVHVCNKMLSDIGCSGSWSKDIIMRGRAVVCFIKEHDAALHIFRGESSQMGLIYPCETRFASVFAMVERLLVVRSTLERMVDRDTWGMVPWDHSVRRLARWVRWQVRHGSWWDSMGILFRIMEPVYDLLRRLDRGGLHMSRVVEWTQDLARRVPEDALPADLAHYIVQRVQARCAHMLEPAHAAAHLLCPNRRDLQYFEGVVSDYDASLVREVETYILSQTGFSVASHDYETACAQCWWSRYGQCAPQLQVIALRVMYMWTCSSSAERNWVVHEGVQTKKRNRLEFEKVAKLVEISANVRLLSHHRAGRGFALPWTLDESLLDVEGGIGIRPSWKGTDESRTREELEDQRRSWQRDPCGSRAPSGDVGDVFGTRAATLHPYPRDDSDSEGDEDEDEPAGPATATPAADERDEWSDLEDVRRRSGRDDLFVPVDLEESGGRHGSHVEQSGIGHRPLGRSSTASSTTLPTSTEELHRQPAGADRLHRLVRGPRQQLEDRLEGGPSPVKGDDGDRQGLVGGDGGALAGGGGGAEVAAAFEGIPMGGGGGFTGGSFSRGIEYGSRCSAGMHESGLAPTEEPRSEPAQPPAVQLRPEKTLQEVAGVPLTAGSVEGVVQMSPGLEDIQMGQSAGVDDIRPSAQAEGIAPTTGGDGAVAGAVGVGGSGVPSTADPMSTSGGGDPAQVDRRDADRQEMPQTLVVRTAVGPMVLHQAPFLEGYRRRAHGRDPVEERRVGRGACIPSVPTFAPSRTRPEIRHVATPRGSLPFGFMAAEELEDHGRRDLTEIHQRVLRSVLEEGKLPHVQDLSWGPASPSLPSGCSIAAPSGGAAGGLPSGGSVTAASGGAAGDLPSGDRPWSEMRRVTMASVGRQPCLRGASTAMRRRNVVASGFGGRGGGGGGSGGQGDDILEGAGGAAASAMDPPLTYGLREASIILQEPDVVTRQRQERHVPLDRRQEGETSGTDGLPMARESRRRDDLAEAGVGRTLRGRRLIMDDDPDECPVAPEPSAGRRGGQRQRDRGRGSGRRGGGGSHRSERDPRAHNDR
ncbi:hypothetical protein CBR_g16152 [Chara braunii]|uniref:DUF659 domain-containing protein n=1 Tax=Chara braunii TaxID=69332 RepID=A0A388KTQ9_CHABU|nr:hypothetical protein CBR_g16152 [Chara braunii]|eukprot:GBG73436.1 hypothetical protein CBR_g16152 [Chara braunii]